VKKELSFFSLCKQAMNSKWSGNENDPKVKFYKECLKDNTVALPIMTKIFDHVLMIKNTRLNSGLVNAICGQLLLQKDSIRKLYLENNGLDGD
jgi:hypothetical protein